MKSRQLELRNKSFTPGLGIDSRYPFASGHQVRNPSGRASHSERLKRIPEWAKHNDQIQALLLRSFPKLEIDPNQRNRAGRWARIIQLYYRAMWTQSMIAEEMGLRLSNINATIRSITRAAEGRQSGTGTGRQGREKRVRL
jgi:hypothetical protein